MTATFILTSQEFAQLVFLYTCRAHLILADFVRQVYWERYAAGNETISNLDAETFVLQAVRDGNALLTVLKKMDISSTYDTRCFRAACL